MHPNRWYHVTGYLMLVICGIACSGPGSDRRPAAGNLTEQFRLTGEEIRTAISKRELPAGIGDTLRRPDLARAIYRSFGDSALWMRNGEWRPA
ncbi:MAG: hypothetical protein RJA57_275, partial [Bacteroidota bacterium]